MATSTPTILYYFQKISNFQKKNLQKKGKKKVKSEKKRKESFKNIPQEYSSSQHGMFKTK
jgi:hypothetical protein